MRRVGMATDVMLASRDERREGRKETGRHVVGEVERPLVKPAIRNRQGTKQVPDGSMFKLEAVSHDWITFRDRGKGRGLGQGYPQASQGPGEEGVESSVD
jgi:hypothetical protein